MSVCIVMRIDWHFPEFKRGPGKHLGSAQAQHKPLPATMRISGCVPLRSPSQMTSLWGGWNEVANELALASRLAPLASVQIGPGSGAPRCRSRGRRRGEKEGRRGLRFLGGEANRHDFSLYLLEPAPLGTSDAPNPPSLSAGLGWLNSSGDGEDRSRRRLSRHAPL